MTRDWSNLSHDILRLIVGKVEKLKDFTSTCAVCSHWNRGIERSDFVRPPLPLLMLPCSHGIGVGALRQCPCQCRQSYSVMENTFHQFDFPEAYGKKCVGSSYGWLIMVEDTSPAVFMLNPLTKERIELPPVTTMLPDIVGFEKEEVGREYIYKDAFNDSIGRYSLKEVEQFFVAKVILSNDPTGEEDCIAVAICGQNRQLVFCIIGHDNKWTPVQGLTNDQQDVVCFKGKFYVVNWKGQVGVFDVSNPQVTLVQEAPSSSESKGKFYVVGWNAQDGVFDVNNPQDTLLQEIPSDFDFHIDKRYLAVDTTGELLHISEYLEDFGSFSHAECDDANDDDANNNLDHLDGHHEEEDDEYYYKTTKFNVFKLNEEKKVWNKLRDIGDNIIFLGDNQSICYSASEYPECSGNSIYFTDDYCEAFRFCGGHDVGIFDINEGLVRKLPCFKENLPFIFPPPVWFTPSLRKITLE